MLNEGAIREIDAALKALETATNCCAWDALESLSRLQALGMAVTIDLQVSRRLGVPVVVARPFGRGQTRIDRLSPRRRQVAVLIATGRSNKQIARELGISPATVKDHVHDILTTLGLGSRLELMAELLGQD